MIQFLLLFVLSVTYLQASYDERAYILLNQDSSYHKEVLYQHNYYDIKEGWNTLTTPKEGVDVQKTFLDGEAIYVHDKHTKLWAAYSSSKVLMQKMHKDTLLELRYIEPNKEFYVLSKKAMRVAIRFKLPNKACQKIMKNPHYELLENSGTAEVMSYNKDKTLAFASRYFSHQRKGIYNDSRVLLMIPKLTYFSKDTKLKRYAPALPKIRIVFNKAYVDKEFYAYDYLNERCYKGYFPSKKRPPAPTMQTIK